VGTRTDQTTAEAIALRAVREVSPGEVSLFRVTASAYFADPERALTVAKGEAKDETLGFGIEVAEAVPLVTTAALWAAQEVLRWVGTQVRDSLQEESSGWIRAWVRRLLERIGVADKESEQPVAPESLTTEQLEQVREIAVSKARELVTEQQAKAIADSIVVGLVLPAHGT
jgi:hypothetical protein